MCCAFPAPVPVRLVMHLCRRRSVAEHPANGATEFCGFPHVSALGYRGHAAPTLGIDFRNPASAAENPMRRFHSLPSTTTRKQSIRFVR